MVESGTPYQQFGITANNVFLYYEDFETAAEFYNDVLGLKQVLDIGTAKMYHVANTSYVTLVRGLEENTVWGLINR